MLAIRTSIRRDLSASRVMMVARNTPIAMTKSGSGPRISEYRLSAADVMIMTTIASTG